jgi:hypothetical protein
MEIKRLNYFTHQLLREQDFKDEQAYHIEMRQRHNRWFHPWGVVGGLEVKEHGPQEIVVEPGTAVDQDGREIVLQEGQERDLSSFSNESEVYIILHYHQHETEHVSGGGVEGHTRITETAAIQEGKRDQPGDPGVVLARVHLGDHGHIRRIDMSPAVRKQAKASAAGGWVRMPFKPVRLNPIRVAGKLVRSTTDEYDFIVDESTAYCDRSARGSMEIPVPPGATQITGFRIAGITKGRVTTRLHRTGWNMKEGKGEFSKVLEEVIVDKSYYKEPTWDERERDLHREVRRDIRTAEAEVKGVVKEIVADVNRVFHKRSRFNLDEEQPASSEPSQEVSRVETSFHGEFEVHSRLDESHALAVSVHAEGETEIWLVAARFE